MRLRQFLRQSAIAGAACTASLVLAGPVLAHEVPDEAPAHPGHAYPGPAYPGAAYPGPRMDPEARDAWLADCRRELGKGKSVAGGTLLGGLVGGVAGNRIAGRGNRTVGTIAGAAIGAGAGMMIDHASDRSRTRDECEAYLEDYEARYSHSGAPGYGYGQGGYGYGYPAYGYGGGCCQPMMMVPVMMMPRAEPECTETVEYVYEDVPVRPARRVVPQKRVKVVPDKRVKVVPVK